MDQPSFATLKYQPVTGARPPMTPEEEATYLRRLAEEFATSPHLGPTARLITAAALDGKAARVERSETDRPRPRKEG